MTGWEAPPPYRPRHRRPSGVLGRLGSLFVVAAAAFAVAAIVRA